VRKCGPTPLKLETQSTDRRTHTEILPCEINMVICG